MVARLVAFKKVITLTLKKASLEKMIKDFLKSPLSCFSLLAIGLFVVVVSGLIDKKEANVLRQKVKELPIGYAEASIPSDNSRVLTESFKPPSPVILINRDSVEKERKAKEEARESAIKNLRLCKKVIIRKEGMGHKFFPNELQVLKKCCSVKLDSSDWQRSYGWPTNAQIKWLGDRAWGKFTDTVCEYFKIRRHAKTILSLSSHESSNSPFAVNDSSCATGNLQIVQSTGKGFALSKEFSIPVEHLNRFNPKTNILMGAYHFQRSMAYFKSRGFWNYADWAILAHNTGSGKAIDTARYYYEKDYKKNHFGDTAGMYEGVDVCRLVEYAPFWQLITGMERIKPIKADEWAIKLWLVEKDYAKIELIRQLAVAKRSYKKAIQRFRNLSRN